MVKFWNNQGEYWDCAFSVRTGGKGRVKRGGWAKSRLGAFQCKATSTWLWQGLLDHKATSLWCQAAGLEIWLVTKFFHSQTDFFLGLAADGWMILAGTRDGGGGDAGQFCHIFNCYSHKKAPFLFGFLDLSISGFCFQFIWRFLHCQWENATLVKRLHWIAKICTKSPDLICGKKRKKQSS